jgi:hypothetical protein
VQIRVRVDLKTQADLQVLYRIVLMKSANFKTKYKPVLDGDANYLKALDAVMAFAVSQDSIMTAYNVINSVQSREPIVVKSLTLYAPTGADPWLFAQQIVDVSGGLQSPLTRIHTALVTLIQYTNPFKTTETCILATVSTFPSLGVAAQRLADFTWSLPVVCCDKTWFPLQLVPELQLQAFQSNSKMLYFYKKALDTRRAVGGEFPAPYESPSPVFNFNAREVCEDGWNSLRLLARFLLKFEDFPRRSFFMPSGFMQADSVQQLHRKARELQASDKARELQASDKATRTPLDWYILASYTSDANRDALVVFFTLPLFLVDEVRTTCFP